jgi:hypothetical protein
VQPAADDANDGDQSHHAPTVKDARKKTKNHFAAHGGEKKLQPRRYVKKRSGVNRLCFNDLKKFQTVQRAQTVEEHEPHSTDSVQNVQAVQIFQKFKALKYTRFA